MASNAKIGLLLGLVVIFGFAFVINGLSGFGNVKDGNDLPPRRVPERHPEETPSPEDKDRFRGQPPGTTLPDETDNHTEPVKQTWPKVHIVRKNDNLADIAKKFYGPKEGNRRANIKRIFEANGRLLESPDKIYPGQELIIPQLWASAPDKKSVESIFPDSMFEEVDSIGRRHL